MKISALAQQGPRCQQRARDRQAVARQDVRGRQQFGETGLITPGDEPYGSQPQRAQRGHLPEMSARVILCTRQEPRAEIKQEQEGQHQGDDAEDVRGNLRRILRLVRGEDLEHLEPFVRAVDQAEQCEWHQRARKTKLGRAAGLEHHHESQGEERQPVEEVDVDDIPHEERGNSFHAHLPQKSLRRHGGHQEQRNLRDSARASDRADASCRA